MLFIFSAYAQSAFQIIPLGVYGGVNDGNLSSYLIAPSDSDQFADMDAGTLVNGLEIASQKKALPNIALQDHETPVHAMLHRHIPSYLISHAHFDHDIGLVIAEPDLREHQTIMARQETMDALIQHVFNWTVWGNFGDAGEKPALKQLHYSVLPLLQWQAIPGTKMQVQAFPLNHGNGYPSTAFLIREKNNYVLYFGDTGSDSIEHDTKIQTIWKAITPLILQHQLKAILLECSFPDSHPSDKLFGHLKPSLWMAELHELAKQVNPNHPPQALTHLPILVTHIKPDLMNGSASTVREIMRELRAQNDLHLRLIQPKQGVRYSV